MAGRAAACVQRRRRGTAPALEYCDAVCTFNRAVEECLIWSFARGEANTSGEIAVFRDSVRTDSCSVLLSVCLTL